MSDLAQLIERVEVADGPDRELDCRIWCAVDGGDFDLFVRVIADHRWRTPHYTSSLDAAMTLVPTGRRMAVRQRRSYEPFWVNFMVDGGTNYDATGRAGTLALAICAASLRALQSGKAAR